MPGKKEVLSISLRTTRQFFNRNIKFAMYVHGGYADNFLFNIKFQEIFSHNLPYTSSGNDGMFDVMCEQLLRKLRVYFVSISKRINRVDGKISLN